jgi:hypothetical protein
MADTRWKNPGFSIPSKNAKIPGKMHFPAAAKIVEWVDA